jgi:hypothetical protein
MPTFGRFGPYRLYFFSNESHEPPHVHVDSGTSTAKFWLAPVLLASSHGFRPHELTQLTGLVRQQEQGLINAWRNHFGP